MRLLAFDAPSEVRLERELLYNAEMEDNNLMGLFYVYSKTGYQEF